MDQKASISGSVGEKPSNAVIDLSCARSPVNQHASLIGQGRNREGLTWTTSNGSGEPLTRSSISSAWKRESALPSQTESHPRWKALNCLETDVTRMNSTRQST